jgi:ATP-dependent RNA helicase DOB1
MSAPDLFSFLDGTPTGDEDKDVDISEQRQVENNAKRRATTDPLSDHPNGGPSDAHAPKKARVSSPVPVVVDEFETEAKREMAASGGLTGSVEAGSKLELRHQVFTSHSYSFH